MLPKNQRVVTAKEFDKAFKEEALIAEFSSSKDEEAYERRDAKLIRLIRKEIRQHFGRNEKKQPYVLDDWWPDHTRFIDATPAHCTPAFLMALRQLLNNDHKDFRIQICVYEDVMEGTTYIGSMALYRDRVLIEKKLHALFHRQNLI
ncbi:MAG TPA: hypothetical protein VF290_08850 [Pyrinomonadaceae bacterium]